MIVMTYYRRYIKMANVPAPITREYTIGQLVNELEKEDRNKPEIVYVFSNGTVKYSTDRTASGIYEL